MNKYISFFQSRFALLCICLLAMTTVFTGCDDDDDELQQTAFGYVQFKLYKSASAATKEQKLEAPTCWTSWVMPRKSRW